MADLSSEPVVDPRLRDYLDAELRRAELDFPHLPRPAAGRARRVALGPVLAALAGSRRRPGRRGRDPRRADTRPRVRGTSELVIVSFATQTDGDRVRHAATDQLDPGQRRIPGWS